MFLKSSSKTFRVNSIYLTMSPFFNKAFSSTNTKINNNLLTRLYKSNTLSALEYTHTVSNPSYRLNPKDVVYLNKVTETMDSETHKVFDLYHKKFFLLQTIDLQTETSWRQANIMLRRYHWDFKQLANIMSFTYDEKASQVKIVSEFHHPIVRDFAFFKKKHNLPWDRSEVRALIWHLLVQVNELKKLGTTTNYLKSSDIYVDPFQNTLKVFEHPGSHLKNGTLQRIRSYFKPQNDLEIVLHTLVKIIDPYAPVDNPQEARAYLKANFPELTKEIEMIESRFRNFSLEPKAEKDNLIYNQITFCLSLHEIFTHNSYDKILQASIREELEKRNLSDLDEKWAFCLQALGKNKEAVEILQTTLLKNIETYGLYHEKITQSYLHLAEAYNSIGRWHQALNYFAKGINSMAYLPLLDNVTKAKLYYEYGKILFNYQRKSEEALENLNEARRMLHNVNYSSLASRLLFDVEQTIKTIERAYKKSDNEPNKENIIQSLIKTYGFKIILLVALIELVLAIDWSWIESKYNDFGRKEVQENVNLKKDYCKNDVKIKQVQNTNKTITINKRVSPVMTNRLKKEDTEEAVSGLLMGLYIIIATAGIAL